MTVHDSYQHSKDSKVQTRQQFTHRICLLSKVAIFAIIVKLEVLRMQPTRVSASEFQAAFGALSDKARHEPVVITKHGKDSLVVMSAEEWARLKRRDRRAGLTAELPEAWIEAVRNAKVPEEFAHLDAELK